jgi:hypothetical protein
MTIDERIEALTMNLELAMKDIEALGDKIEALGAFQKQTSQDIANLHRIALQDGENIRALARIAEIHERRLSSLEGGDQ